MYIKRMDRFYDDLKIFRIYLLNNLKDKNIRNAILQFKNYHSTPTPIQKYKFSNVLKEIQQKIVDFEITDLAYEIFPEEYQALQSIDENQKKTRSSFRTTITFKSTTTISKFSTNASI